jgi:hypothetical protein
VNRARGLEFTLVMLPYTPTSRALRTRSAPPATCASATSPPPVRGICCGLGIAEGIAVVAPSQLSRSVTVHQHHDAIGSTARG